jgi:hypothetical protein
VACVLWGTIDRVRETCDQGYACWGPQTRLRLE